MKSYHTKTLNLGNSRGGVLVLVALLLFVFIGIAALAIDIGHINTTKNELQNVADAAALAGTGKLGKIYLDLGVFSGSGVIGVDEVTAIKLDAKTVGLSNNASGLPISVDGNIQLGKWDTDANTFTSFSDSDFTTSPLPWPNAVKVTAKRVEGTNGVINSLFAGLFGIDSFGVTADAVAALTGQSEFKPGELKLPIAVSELMFPDQCQDPLVFNSNDDCTAWHQFNPDDNINANALGDVLLGSIVAHDDGLSWLVDDMGFRIDKTPVEFISSGIIAGDTRFNLTEGGNSSMFTSNENMPIPPMVALFDFFKTRDNDENDEIWTTTIPVYGEPDGAEDCEPTSARDSFPIVGAADIVVRTVHPPDAKDEEGNPIGNTLDVQITCSYKPVRGGGGGGGNLGAIPNIVE